MKNTLKILCNISDIPEGTTKGFSLTTDNNVQDIFIVNRDNQFYGYENHCPHTGVNLNWQPDIFMDFDNNYIQCSVHGARFNVESGLCVWGPCVNQSLKKIEIEVHNGNIALTSKHK